jgi:hypothetical protein
MSPTGSLTHEPAVWLFHVKQTNPKLWHQEQTRKGKALAALRRKARRTHPNATHRIKAAYKAALREQEGLPID